MLLGMILIATIVHLSETYLRVNEVLVRMLWKEFGSIAGNIPFLLLASSLNHRYRTGPSNNRHNFPLESQLLRLLFRHSKSWLLLAFSSFSGPARAAHTVVNFCFAVRSTSIGRHYTVKEMAKFIEKPGGDSICQRLKANATDGDCACGFVLCQNLLQATFKASFCQTLSDLQAAGYPPCPPEYKALLSLFSFSSNNQLRSFRILAPL